jgi:hypothetical protein
MRRRNVEDRRKEEKLTAPITLPPLDEQTLTELRQRYDEASDAETRTRYQMLLLAQRGQISTQIAAIVLRSQDTGVRVLKRFLTGGLAAVPRRTAEGARSDDHPSLGERTAASHRIGPTRGGSRHGQLDHSTACHLPVRTNGHQRLTRDRARLLACA